MNARMARFLQGPEFLRRATGTEMTLAARRFMHSLAARLPIALALLLVLWAIASPWIIVLYGGWRLALRLYPIQYLLVFLGFALVMALVYRRELIVRILNWRAARKIRRLREPAKA
jgi:hypothetical protein